MSSLLAAGGRQTAPSSIAAAKPGASHAIGHSSHPHLHLYCSHLERGQHVRRSLHTLQHECCTPALRIALAAFPKKLKEAEVPDLRACQVSGAVLLRMVRGWLMLPQRSLEICQAKGRRQRIAGSRRLATIIPDKRSKANRRRAGICSRAWAHSL